MNTSSANQHLILSKLLRISRVSLPIKPGQEGDYSALKVGLLEIVCVRYMVQSRISVSVIGLSSEPDPLSAWSSHDTWERIHNSELEASPAISLSHSVPPYEYRTLYIIHSLGR